MTTWLKLGKFFKITKSMYTTNMRYTFVSCKGNHGQIVIKKSGWIADPPLESVGGAGEK